LCKWAFEEGLHNISHYIFPSISRRGVDADSLRRSTYSDDEYNLITRALISYTARKTAQRDFLSDDDLFVRQLVRHFFLLGANTMMRFGELYQLKWGNIETYTAENQRLVTINVLAETSKVRQSRVIKVRGGKHFDRLRSLSRYTKQNDYVFTANSGERVTRDALYYHYTQLMELAGFTGPGLSKNIELNVQVQSASEVAQLQSWYEEFWAQGEDISQDLLNVITPHVTAWSPFDIYSQSLRELFRGKDATSSVWEENESLIFSKLDRYQKEAYWSLVKISKRFGGAFLGDGVGLGKTFVGLMLIERMVRDKKHVVLFAPKVAKEGVWDPKLRELIPDLFGTDFSNLAVFSHTDLQREGDYPDRFKRIAEIAVVVIVDEAHHFRNQGTQGDPETGKKRSRYYKFMDLLHQGNPNKTLFMLTATPINNRLTDLRHMIELFTGMDEAHFSRTLGIHNLRNHFNRLERNLKKTLGSSAESLGENIREATEFLADDEIFENLIVQRSRAYAVESQKNEFGAAASFPSGAS